MGQKIGQMALNGKDNSGSFEIRFLYILTWVCSVCCQSDPVWALTPDPPENCHLNVKEIAKNLTFVQNNCQNCHSFPKKNCHWLTLRKINSKKWQFLAIFWKKCQVFGNFFYIQMAIFRMVRSESKEKTSIYKNR